jgi:hypothetical protein
MICKMINQWNKLTSWLRRKILHRYAVGEYRPVKDDELFAAGRSFRMNLKTGKSEVLVEKGKE